MPAKKRPSSKACIVKSGPKKGKLMKGFRFDKSGRCVKAKAAAPSKSKKRGKSTFRKMTAAEARSFDAEFRAAAKRPGVMVGTFEGDKLVFRRMGVDKAFRL